MPVEVATNPAAWRMALVTKVGLVAYHLPWFGCGLK